VDVTGAKKEKYEAIGNISTGIITEEWTT